MPELLDAAHPSVRRQIAAMWRTILHRDSVLPCIGEARRLREKLKECTTVVVVRQVAKHETQLRHGLCALLIDAVHNGASVGFLAPLSLETATRYWEQALSSLGSGLVLWVAESEGSVVGSVQLALSEKDNGRHRAEIQKLFVLSSHRGRGIATRLMDAAESFARSIGRTLLVLDTQAGSLAESVYRHLGWQRVGEIPRYAASPDGQLQATVYYFKEAAL